MSRAGERVGSDDEFRNDWPKQAVHAELEHLGEVDAALRMVAPGEGGAMDVLKGIQVSALPTHHD